MQLFSGQPTSQDLCRYVYNCSYVKQCPSSIPVGSIGKYRCGYKLKLLSSFNNLLYLCILDRISSQIAFINGSDCKIHFIRREVVRHASCTSIESKLYPSYSSSPEDNKLSLIGFDKCKSLDVSAICKVVKNIEIDIAVNPLLP